MHMLRTILILPKAHWPVKYEEGIRVTYSKKKVKYKV